MPARLPELRRLGVDICSSLDLVPEHPADSKLAGISGVIFTGPPQDPEAHLRNVTVGSGGSVDLSASGTGTSAVMAVLHTRGRLALGGEWRQESITGSRFTGWLTAGPRGELVPHIRGSAFITGDAILRFDPADPFRLGIGTQ
jgi:4-hydroxyproline epimerase